jgi:hypothetical protein
MRRRGIGRAGAIRRGSLTACGPWWALVSWLGIASGLGLVTVLELDSCISVPEKDD